MLSCSGEAVGGGRAGRGVFEGRPIEGGTYWGGQKFTRRWAVTVRSSCSGWTMPLPHACQPAGSAGSASPRASTSIVCGGMLKRSESQPPTPAPSRAASPTRRNRESFGGARARRFRTARGEA